MTAINLLPKDLTPKEGVVKIAFFIKKMATIGYIALLVTLIALIVSYFYIDGQVSKAMSRQERLGVEISALEQTEVRLVLVKDRLQKAESIFSENTTVEEVNNLESIIDLSPEGVTLSEVFLSPSSTKLSISAQNSSSLVEFLAVLVSSGIYSDVTLSFLEYSQATGNYSISLILSG